MATLEARDREGAIALVRELRGQGATGVQLITELLVPAQRRVGELWQNEVWTVAQEHAASSIVDISLAEVELHTDVVPILGTVVVACAEGEWHSLPARMLAEQLRHLGWAVTFVGASAPASQLGRFLSTVEPAAVLVSCSIPTFLLGAQRSIDATHGRGLPALAGGAGFGTDDRRAIVLGADGWAPTAAAAHELLSSWSEHPPGLRAPSSNPAALSLEAVRGVVVESAMVLLADRAVPVHTRDELSAILRFVEASLLLGDPTIVDEHLAWLELVVAARGMPADSVDVSLAALNGALPAHQAEARALLERP